MMYEDQADKASLRGKETLKKPGEIFKEVFLYGQCGQVGQVDNYTTLNNDTEKAFWKWCAGEGGRTVETKCANISGRGITTVYGTVENATFNGFGIPTINIMDEFGPGKGINNTYYESQMTDDELYEIWLLCYQEVHGYPPQMPLWLIILIVFLTLLAVGTSAVLFWKYWVRPTFYGKPRNQKDVSLRSRRPSGSNRASQTLHRPGSVQR